MCRITPLLRVNAGITEEGVKMAVDQFELSFPYLEDTFSIEFIMSHCISIRKHFFRL